jgi:hypothetical protein
MSLELAQKFLQLFDGGLELGKNLSRIQKPSKSEKNLKGRRRVTRTVRRDAAAVEVQQQARHCSRQDTASGETQQQARRKCWRGAAADEAQLRKLKSKLKFGKDMN